MNNALTEIVREIPPEVAARHGRGASPVFIAHGCVLLERFAGKSYMYKAVNLKNNKYAQISRRIKPMPESDYEAAAIKIRASGIAGVSRYTVDKPPGERLEREEVTQIQDIIFKEILPLYGSQYVLHERNATIQRQAEH